MIKGFGEDWIQYAQHRGRWRAARDIYAVAVAQHFEAHGNDDYAFSLNDWLAHRRSCIENHVDLTDPRFVRLCSWTDAVAETLRSSDPACQHTRIHITGDSQVAINTAKGIWNARTSGLHALVRNVMKLVQECRAAGYSLSIDWLPRALNDKADHIANVCRASRSSFVFEAPRGSRSASQSNVRMSFDGSADLTGGSSAACVDESTGFCVAHFIPKATNNEAELWALNIALLCSISAVLNLQIPEFDD